jgi:bifunctional non-homologous end joining protein LigD
MARVKRRVAKLAYSLLKNAIKSPFPKAILPMLATKIDKPFNDPDWLYEIKWDGYRIISHVLRGKATMHSRSLQNYTSWYPPIAKELASFNDDMVLDGEIAVLNQKGFPDFDALQKYRQGDPIMYYVFDLLWYNGCSLTQLPLENRKRILDTVLPSSDLIRYSHHFDDGIALYEKMESLGIEGVICKRRNSLYESGLRTKDWLKLPTSKRQEFVIGGWTESGSNRPFRSILFGAYDGDRLVNIGHSGSGFRATDMKQILAKLRKLETKKSHFAGKVETETKPHWVKPELIGEFKYATTTASGKIRKPAIFLGFRDDKDPKKIRLEKTFKTEEIVEEKKPVRITSTESNWPEIENQPISSRGEIEIDHCKLELTNVEKELWSDVTKADLIQYYNRISEYILPYVKDRPQSLHVKYKGPLQQGVYIKDMEGRGPEWVQLFSVQRKHKRKGKNDIIDYLVCNNRPTLLWMINLGCIDVNPWTSRITNYLHPDFIVIDLDPSEKDFKKAVETARAAKQFFDENNLKAFAKTSGKTGIHLCLPCEGFAFAQARSIALKICNEIHSLVPDITTTEVSISRRGDKLYIDPNQNDEADTLAAPYSARPYYIPTVSTPLVWKEVNEKLNASDFTIKTIPRRVEKKGDLWSGISNPKIISSNSQHLRKFF